MKLINLNRVDLQMEIVVKIEDPIVRPRIFKIIPFLLNRPWLSSPRFV